MQADLFTEKPIIISSFFHFSQSIYRKLKEYKIIKKSLIKYGYEILRNIEIICFIDPKLIKDYEIFLKKNLKTEKEKKLFNYIKNYWLKKDFIIFNYSILKEKTKNKKVLEQFYIINNIAEWLHSKINYYLPKRRINANDFLYCVKNIMNLNEIKNNKIIRKDIISKTLIKLTSNIKDINFK